MDPKAIQHFSIGVNPGDLRSYFAALAMAGQFATTGEGEPYGGFKSAAALARTSVVIADALIAALQPDADDPEETPDFDAQARELLGDTPASLIPNEPATEGGAS